MKGSGCARLDSQLLQLAQAPDPAAFAARAGLDYREGMVRVVVEVRPGAAVPQGHGLVVEARYQDLIQAQAPLTQLCPLAGQADVLAIRPSARPLPGAPG